MTRYYDEKLYELIYSFFELGTLNDVSFISCLFKDEFINIYMNTTTTIHYFRYINNDKLLVIEVVKDTNTKELYISILTQNDKYDEHIDLCDFLTNEYIELCNYLTNKLKLSEIELEKIIYETL